MVKGKVIERISDANCMFVDVPKPVLRDLAQIAKKSVGYLIVSSDACSAVLVLPGSGLRRWALWKRNVHGSGRALGAQVGGAAVPPTPSNI